ncbi:MAG: ThuA domain-containing protein [bacterium]
MSWLRLAVLAGGLALGTVPPLGAQVSEHAPPRMPNPDFPTAPRAPARVLRALIVDGINNHDWERGTQILKEILVASGRFTVDVSTSPPAGAAADAWTAWRPAFSGYDVVIDNWNGGHKEDGVRWPPEVEKAFEAYVRGGGGLVNVHAANNAFLRWPAFNEMIGLGWRPPEFGPSLVVDAQGRVQQIPAGEGRPPGHGQEHDFQITTFDRRHPITKGLPAKWMHPLEQLTHGQHGPAKSVRVLTCAWSKDTQQNEVLDWVVPYGRGRVYTTMLGHLWRDGAETAVRCAGFQTLLARGAEWAATGKVTLRVPKDFPTAEKISVRE